MTTAPHGGHVGDVEDLVQTLNRELRTSHDARLTDVGERLPTLQIVGAPRSGTTLLSQLLAAHLDVGYIDNLIAAFWATPLYGIRLSKMLLAGERPSSFESSFGRTSSVSEPHEFGYFWRSMLGYDSLAQSDAATASTNWTNVARTINNIVAEFDRPVVFKSLQLIWQMEEFQAALPKTCFVWVRRSTVDNALSLLALRDAYFGDRSRWASLRPSTADSYTDRDPAEQVVRQVLDIEAEIATTFRRLRADSVVEVSYESLCERPADVLDRCRAVLAANGAMPALVGGTPRRFPPATARRDDPDALAVEHFAAELGER